MRLLIALLVAGALSLLTGLAASATAGVIPCQGEGLACALNEAIGGYAVLIWTVLGPVIFGVVLLVARNRVALAGATILLLAPLVAFLIVTQIEAWQTIGVEPYKELREVLVMIAPPALTVIMQWLVLKFALGLKRAAASGPATPAPKDHPMVRTGGVLRALSDGMSRSRRLQWVKPHG
jgi:hypothetical protein